MGAPESLRWDSSLWRSRSVHVPTPDHWRSRLGRPAELEQLVHTHRCDCEVAGLESTDPVVLLEIPHVELQHGLGAFEQALQLHGTNAGLRRIVAPDDVQYRHDCEAKATVVLHVRRCGFVAEHLPSRLAHRLVTQVILGT